jgi:hypothetical protein
MDVEIRILVLLDRPDGEAEQRNNREQQPDQDMGGDRKVSYLPARYALPRFLPREIAPLREEDP